MRPTFPRSVRPRFGTSDDLLSVYDRSNARGRLGDSHWFAAVVGGVLSARARFADRFFRSSLSRPSVPDYLAA
jgi:hypothetical protein